MGVVSEWASSILSFLILITVIRGILPSKKYEPYLRLFSGLALILLVLQPITSGLGLETQIDRAFEAFSFQMDHEELNTQVLGIEKERQAKILKVYENDVADHVMAMAGEQGLQAESAQVEISGDPESAEYGKVILVKVKLQSGEKAGDSGETKQNGEVEAVQPVQNIEVQSVQIGEETKAGAGNLAEETSEKSQDQQTNGNTDQNIGQSTFGNRQTNIPADSRILEFQIKVEQYYGLESGAVEIQS